MNAQKTLLHLCCAPDGTIPWPKLIEEGFDVTGYFYGSNIHPTEEWQKRAQAIATLARHVGALVLIDDYVPKDWLEPTQGLKDSPEGGNRCELCFRLQLQSSAKHAVAIGASLLCTTLTISPHKNVELINQIGRQVSDEFGLQWLDRIWRKDNGFVRSVVVSKEMGLYRQNYCGCVYSVRTQNY